MPAAQNNPRERDYRVRNVTQAVLNGEWAILPEKLQEITAFLEARNEGQIPTEEELNERFGPSGEQTQEENQILSGGIQVIDVMGTLSPRMNLMSRMSGGTSTQQLAQQIRDAGNNQSVNAIVLRVDSPGGAAAYTPEVAQVIREVATRKRVVTSATNMMASGAYWIGVAATEAYASPSTQVGSIGVYSILSNTREMYERAGVKFTVLRAGDLKAAGNPYEELTAERKAALQDRVLKVYEQFLGAVAEYRNVTVATVEHSFGQGNVFLAGEAKDRGMIDGVATFEDVVAREQERIFGASKTPPQRVEEKNMDPKLKAALFARSLITSLEIADEVARAALNGFCAAKGIDPKLSDEELLKELTEQKTTILSTLETTDNVVAPPTAAEERARIMDIQSRGRMLNVAEPQIQEAIESGLDASEAVDRWTQTMAQTNRTLQPLPGEGESDKLVRGASAVLISRCATGLAVDLTEEEKADLRNFGGAFQYARTIDICRTQMRAQGRRLHGDPIEDARLYLQDADIVGPLAADGGTANYSGAHPDMLSALTRKSLNAGAMLARVTYPLWTGQLEDMPDFRPKSFIDVGIFNRLDAIRETQEFEEMQFNTDLSHWIKVDRYGNKVGLTVEMIVGDDLGGFARQLRSLGIAARMTLQANILDLLNANPTMLDGYAFFSAQHENLQSSTPAKISSTQLKLHRKLHRLNKSFGSEYPMGADISGVLVPAEQEEDALQTLATTYEVKVANADTSINTFRGQVTPVIDAHLDAYSTTAWYSFIPTEQAAAIVYSFQSGYGAAGRREQWYDPGRKTRFISVESRFGVAMANWRAMVKNPGT